MQKLGVSPMIWFVQRNHSNKNYFRSPLAGGKLFAPESEQDEKTKRVVKELCVIAKELGPLVTIDQVAYAFINKVPCNPVVVVGTNNVKRVKSVVESLNVVLDKTQWFRILVASQGHGIPQTSEIVKHYPSLNFNIVMDMAAIWTLQGLLIMSGVMMLF